VTPPAARLAALGRALLPPRRRPVAIVDAEAAGDLLPYVREGAATIVDLRRAHLNAWVLARTLLRGRRSMLDYAAAYLRAVKPSVVLTMIDTTPLFYRLKARWPSATYISVQNGWRGHEFVRDLHADGDEPLVADHVLCFGEAAAGLFRAHIDAEPVLIGSLRNNAAPQGGPQTGPDTVALISTLRDKVDLDSWMVGYGGEPLVRYREVFERRLTFASWVAEFSRSAGLHLRVVGKDLDSPRERGFYRDLLGPEGDGWSFAARRGPHSSYEEISRARIVVSTSSTLGYEALARGIRTAFFMLDAELPGRFGDRFGWPLPLGDDGPLWANRLDRDAVAGVLGRLHRMDDDEWSRALRDWVPRLIDHDPGNTRLCALLGSLGVGRP
jgi:surface carbohydrate biosynthesis protein